LQLSANSFLVEVIGVEPVTFPMSIGTLKPAELNPQKALPVFLINKKEES
jgi:hypothetical protein